MPLVGANGEPLSAGQPQDQTQPGDDQTPEEPKPPVRAVTAFLVYQLPIGRWLATDNLAEAIVPMRQATFDDIIAGTANVQAEITARKTADMAAAMTIQTQVAMTRQIQEQALNKQVQDALAAGGTL